MAAKNRRLYIGISVELRQKQCSIEISATNFGIFDHDDLGKSVSKWSRQRWTTENKTAELAQRTPRDASNIWVPWKVLRVLTTHPATFPEICSRLLFRSILRMCVQKLKFVALPVPEIIGGTPKIWAVPGFAHAPYSPKFLKGFCSHGPCEYTCQVWRS